MDPEVQSPKAKISYRGRQDRALVAEVDAAIIACRTSEIGVVAIIDGKHSDVLRLFVGIVRTLRGEGTPLEEVMGLVVEAYHFDEFVTEVEIPGPEA